MKALAGLFIFIVILALLVCVVGWIFATDFLIFDILLTLALIAIQFIIPIIVLIGIIWVILELFR
jgi:hypothetical protein